METAYNDGETYTDYIGNVISHKEYTVYKDSSNTQEGIKTVTNFYNNFPIDYSHPYKLRVQDNSGKYFPYVNENFYLDESTGITYITLNKVAACYGVSLEYQSKASEKLNNQDSDSSLESMDYSITKINETFNGKTVEDISSEVKTINKWAVDSFKMKAVCNIDSSDTVVACNLLQETDKGKRSVNDCTKEMTVKEDNAKKYIDITLEVDTEELLPEKDIYLQCFMISLITLSAEAL